MERTIAYIALVCFLLIFYTMRFFKIKGMQLIKIMGVYFGIIGLSFAGCDKKEKKQEIADLTQNQNNTAPRKDTQNPSTPSKPSVSNKGKGEPKQVKREESKSAPKKRDGGFSILAKKRFRNLRDEPRSNCSRPSERSSFKAKRDLNQHNSWPYENTKQVQGDSLGTLYVRASDKTFYITRWPFEKGSSNPAVEFTLTKEATVYRDLISEVVLDLNNAAREMEVTGSNQDLIRTVEGLGDRYRISDCKTHLIDVRDYDVKPLAYTYPYFDSETGEILDADIELDQKAIERDVSTNPDNFDSRMKHILMQQFLHALGFDENLLGEDYLSMMDQYSSNNSNGLKFQLNRSLKTRYDLEVLKYLYTDTTDGFSKWKLQRMTQEDRIDRRIFPVNKITGIDGVTLTLGRSIFILTLHFQMGDPLNIIISANDNSAEEKLKSFSKELENVGQTNKVIVSAKLTYEQLIVTTDDETRYGWVAHLENVTIQEPASL